MHAVEQERIPFKRLEDAHTRLRRAKERFLAAPVASGRLQAQPSSGARVRRASAHRRGDGPVPVSRRLPAALKAGDRVAIVSPASPLAREEFEGGLAEIRRLGFVPVYDETVFATEAGYLSGSPDLRAGAFRRHWNDPDVAALIAARGGYGSATFCRSSIATRSHVRRNCSSPTAITPRSCRG